MEKNALLKAIAIILVVAFISAVIEYFSDDSFFTLVVSTFVLLFATSVLVYVAVAPIRKSLIENGKKKAKGSRR